MLKLVIKYGANPKVLTTALEPFSDDTFNIYNLLVSYDLDTQTIINFMSRYDAIYQ